MSRPAPHQPQRGFTLVSTMVGLLLSLLGCAGMLTMYKLVARETSLARSGASSDDQLMSALLRAQAHLQDAGFGIPSAAYGADVVVLSGASLVGSTLSGTVVATGSPGNAVVWATARSGAKQCAGLIFQRSPNGVGGLQYLKPVACSSAANSTSGTWVPSLWIADPAGAPVGAVVFTASASPCVPFGLDALASSLRITIQTTLGGTTAMEDTQCLINFRS